MGKKYGFLSAENKQRVSGEMDSGTKDPKRSGDPIGREAREGCACLGGTVRA